MLVPFSWVLGPPSCIWVMLHFFCWSECIHTLIWESVLLRSHSEVSIKWNLGINETCLHQKNCSVPKIQISSIFQVLLHVTILERKRNKIPCRSVVGRFHCILAVEFLCEFSQNRFVFMFGSRTLGVWQFFSVVMECISVHIVCRYFCQIY